MELKSLTIPRDNYPETPMSPGFSVGEIAEALAEHHNRQ
jgi:hypothetical protein